ncbi:hypothetical protein DID88_003436 [Monilinia fructigena]|uniref:Deacetylase sirtuin-type domain-containing protein n=1 Tax=Monilinia fructigena TaxID=38457 RepID=A0A395IU44_9HELO|nr:hypothetical protein DID88_003436 [Monilinia fructigena]
MLATLAEEGRLLRLYSQNVDGIDTSLQPLATKVPLNSKGPWPKTIQLHGGLAKMVQKRQIATIALKSMQLELPRVREDTELAGCDLEWCLYNEYNPDEEAIGAGFAVSSKKCAVQLEIAKNGFYCLDNLDGEPGGPDFKDCWDLIVRGECDEVARHAGLPKWDDKDLGQYSVVTNEDEAGKKREIDKVLVTPARSIAAADAFPTPGASPRGPTEKGAAKKSAKRKAPADAKIKKPRAPSKSKAISKLKKQLLPGENLKLSMATTKSSGTEEVKNVTKGKARKKLPSKPEVIESAKLENPVLEFDYPLRIVPESQAHGTRGTCCSNTATYCSSKSYFSYKGLATVYSSSRTTTKKVESSPLSDTHTIPETPSSSGSPTTSVTFDREATIHSHFNSQKYGHLDSSLNDLQLYSTPSNVLVCT